VAITGAAAYLGRSLIALLEEDDRISSIVAVDVEPPATAGHKTRFVEIDLGASRSEERLAEALKQAGVSALVHLAFLSGPTRESGGAHELESVGTMHAINACRRAEVHKLVQWSHTWLYGAEPTNPNFLTEDHPLRARRDEPFFADRIEAEAEALRFARPGKGRVVTLLRTAPMIGPTVHNTLTRTLRRRLVPAVLGFDPLWQFVHESDAVAAFKLAVDRDCPGVFNVAGVGVLPWSTVIKLAGRAPLLLPRSVLQGAAGAAWRLGVGGAPPALLDYLQYLCVVDGGRAQQVLGFDPAYTSREALLEYVDAQRRRESPERAETVG
jgi:UDP-glucose 4-epimerase